MYARVGLRLGDTEAERESEMGRRSIDAKVMNGTIIDLGHTSKTEAG